MALSMLTTETFMAIGRFAKSANKNYAKTRMRSTYHLGTGDDGHQDQTDAKYRLHPETIRIIYINIIIS